MPFLPPNRQRHSTEGIKVLATVCVYSIFGHLYQFLVMLQICFRPAVQCNSTLVLFCYLSSVCLFYFRFYYCLHICANTDRRWADDAHLPSVIPSIMGLLQLRYEHDSATTRYEVFRALAYEIVYENQW